MKWFGHLIRRLLRGMLLGGFTCSTAVVRTRLTVVQEGTNHKPARGSSDALVYSGSKQASLWFDESPFLLMLQIEGFDFDVSSHRC